MHKKERKKLYNSAWRKANREKCRDQHAKWRASNPERVKELQKIRYEKNGDKIRARAKELYAQNRDRILARKAAWSASNPDKVKAIKARCRTNPEYREKENNTHKKWLVSNAERVAAYSAEYRTRIEVKKRQKAWLAEWHKKHPEARSLHERNRKARKLRVGGNHTEDDIRQLYFAQNGQCVYCPTKLKKYHVDHIIPLALGGNNGKENIQLLCPTCNMSKHTKHPIDFMKSKGLSL